MSKILNKAIQIIENQLKESEHPDGKFLFLQERRLTNRIKKIFNKQLDWVLTQLPLLSIFQKNTFAKFNNDFEAELNILLNKMPYRTELTEQIIASMSLTMLKSGKKQVRTFNLKEFGIDFSLQNQQAIKFLQAKKLLELSDYKGNIGDTTKQKILEILREGIQNGSSYGEIAELIKEQGTAGVFSKARGELIAIQEIGAAYGIGNHIPMMELKMKYLDRQVQKKWLTVGDDKVRPSHRANERMGWIDIEAPFTGNNGDGTGEYYAPSKEFRCRCVTNYKIL